MESRIAPPFLPTSILDLIEVVGIPAALAIVRERGGIRLYVPHLADPEHQIAEWIGIDAMQALVDVFAGEEIEIPRCDRALRAERAYHIGQRYDAGESQAELARAYAMTERNIKLILAKRRMHPEYHQSDLFSAV